jgi:hypothetical protein
MRSFIRLFKKVPVFVVLATAFLMQLWLINPARLGETYDDSFYVTAAKSLATGEGYRNINLPGSPAQTLIPPFYPFLLSLIWRAYPRFPDNLIWMMLFSALAMAAFLWLTSRYLIAERYATPVQALAIVSLAAINWRMMSLATSIISDVVFALVTVAALYVAEKYERERGVSIAGALALISGLVVLTRISGMVLLVAIAFYYVLRRQWKKALLPVGVGALFVAGWLGWCYLNSSGGEGAAYYASYLRGINVTLGKLQSLNQTSTLSAQLKIIETNALGLILVWAPLESLGLRATLPTTLLIPIILLFLGLAAAGFIRGVRKGIRLLHVYFIFYLALHLIVPSHSYERYLIPVVPFFLYFVISELSALFLTLKSSLLSTGDVLAKALSAIVGLAVAAVAGLSLYSNATGIYLTLTSPKHTIAHAADVDTVEWIKQNTDPSDVLVCFSDLKYYLLTGRKAVRSVPVPILDISIYQNIEPEPGDLIAVFLSIVKDNRGTYFVLDPTDFEVQAPAYGKSVQGYVEQHPEEFVPVFQSPREGRIRVYRIEGHAYDDSRDILAPSAF